MIIKLEGSTPLIPKLAIGPNIEPVPYKICPHEIHFNVILPFIHEWLYSPLLGPDLFFTFLILFYIDGRTPWTGD
jgi:hypothetical protein